MSENEPTDHEQGYSGEQNDPVPNEDRTAAGQFELHLYGSAPDKGPTAGGTPLTVSGTGLSEVTAVQLGGQDAEFVIEGEGQALKVTTPPGTEGQTVGMTVATADDTTDLSDVFTYTDENA